MPPPEQRKPVSFVSRFNRWLNWLLVKLKVDDVPHIKRIVVTVVGGTVLIFGVALIVTPGPATLVIPLGLAILGTEYAWARRWLRKARKMAQQALSKTQEIIGTGNSSNATPREEEKPSASSTPSSPVTTTPPATRIPAAEMGEDAPPRELAGAGRQESSADPRR